MCHRVRVLCTCVTHDVCGKWVVRHTQTHTVPPLCRLIVSGCVCVCVCLSAGAQTFFTEAGGGSRAVWCRPVKSQPAVRRCVGLEPTASVTRGDRGTTGVCKVLLWQIYSSVQKNTCWIIRLMWWRRPLLHVRYTSHLIRSSSGALYYLNIS